MKTARPNRHLHWGFPLVLVVGALFLARPAWDVAADFVGDWQRSRAGAQRRERLAKLPKRPPPLRIARDLPRLQAILDSIDWVEVRVVHASLDSMGLSAGESSRVSVSFEKWWPRFRESFLSYGLDEYHEANSSYPYHLRIQCRGSRGNCDVWLGPAEHGSQLQIAWSDSLGDHRLRRRPFCQLMSYADFDIRNLPVGVRID